MKPATRLLIDCSHFFVANEKRGIDRVLSQILSRSESIASDQNVEVAAVAWLPDGHFHHVPLRSAAKRGGDSWKALSRAWLKVCVFVVPYAAVICYRKVATYLSDRRLGVRYPKVRFRPSDTLLLADANWNLPARYLQALPPVKTVGVKITLLVYDLIPIRFPQFVDDRLNNAFRRWFEVVMSVTDKALAISRSVQEDLDAYAQDKGFNGLETAVTYLGADYSQSQGGGVRSELQDFFSLGRPYLVVGALEPRKRQDLIFAAFQTLWAKGITAKLCFIGKVLPGAYDLLNDIRSTPQWGRELLVFEGASDDELAFCYANARALIAASVAEGFDLPTVEARGHSLPVLASDTRVHHEVGRSGVTYFESASLQSLVEAIETSEADPSSFVQENQFTWWTWDQSVAQIVRVAVDGADE